jgi:hypothetical protein
MITINLTPAQANLVIAALQADVTRAEQLISQRRNPEDNLAVRQVITQLHSQGVR